MCGLYDADRIFVIGATASLDFKLRPIQQFIPILIVVTDRKKTAGQEPKADEHSKEEPNFIDGF